ncbi:L-seryl-tRNA(Sec) kinase [Musca vetustissima]|uniref:L-seryl-tRNA(Sec) kinase n=1 Tax=Musca vetustissima TaxID=27455 RepID=UPI002AB5EBE0|nr:L-seryl-tRNA(Sec) kinase [Musca vetustissima]
MDEMCIIALIGLPGVGKTTFCKLLLQSESLSFNIFYICYDDFIKITQENLVQYKEQREQLLNSLETLVATFKTTKTLDKTLMPHCSTYKDNGNDRLLILCDDNHYYGSMRYRLYQIARNYSLSYGQLYFNCSLELALQQNALRNEFQRVPNEIIKKMHSKLEIPDSKTNYWEENTLSLIPQNITKEYISLHILPYIVKLFAEPLKPLQIPDKCPTKQSQVHELDLQMRKHIGVVITKIDGGNVNKKQVALPINDLRKNILSECKGLEQVEDVDINRFLQLFQGQVESFLQDQSLMVQK